MTVPPFPRTVCACPQCIEPCHRQPGPLAPGDFGRIKAHLGLASDDMKKLFWRSPGALVQHRATGRTYRVGTITPQRKAGKCIFLDDQDRCSIHEVAPMGCAYFDTHMSLEEGQRRGNWLVIAQHDPDYQKLRATLPEATSYKPRQYLKPKP